MRKYLITAILLSLTTICFAQQPTIVFDQEGRIIKKYGLEKNGNEYTFLIEGVRSSDSVYYYYLIYQWRDDYLYGANNTFEGNSVTHIGEFNNQGYLKISDVSRNDKKIDPLLSYQLIKVNANGKDYLINCIDKKSECGRTLYRLEALNKESIVTDIKVFIPNEATYTSDNFIKKLLELEIYEERLEELVNEKKKGTFSDDYPRRLREKSLLDKKLGIREQQLEKLQGNTKECCTADNIDDVTEQVIELTKKVQSIEEKINSLLKEHEDLITTERRKISSLKNEIENIITDTSKLNIDISPVYTFLHQGVLISKGEKRFEIAYDVKNQRLFDSGINRFNIARLTPDLPQLTTESELYLRILNLSSSELDENPFVISMESSLSAEVAIESPANFRPLQSVDLGSIFAGIDVPAFNEDYQQGTDMRYVSDDKIDIEVIQEDSVAFQSQYQDDLDHWVEEILAELDQFQKRKIAKGYINKIISNKLNKYPNFRDYLLKYPKPFEATKSPSISLKAVQPEVENFSQKVDEGTLKNESYDIKYVTKTLVADTLPPVHRLYRFALNTGLVASLDVSYSYHRTPLPNTSVDQLSEIKDNAYQIRPILTLSTYFWKQDLAVDPDLTNLIKFRWQFWNTKFTMKAWKELFKTLHIDIGLNYAQKNIFDDLYLGVGIEPARLINFGGGIKIINLKKIDRDKLDPVALDISTAMTNETYIRPYISINLGLSIIPSAINALL